MIKTFAFAIFLTLFSFSPEVGSSSSEDLVRSGSKVGKDCTFRGKKLYGKIKVVTAFPDFKVQKVTAFPDLKVQKVTAFPSSCGKWKFVDAFPDFTIQYVDAFPDFKIKFVDAFPGVP